LGIVGAQERERYEAFARRHYDDVVKKAAMFVGYQAAPDLAQEVFLKLWKSRALERYEDRGQVQAWLLQIVVHSAIDHRRKKRVVIGSEDPLELAREVASNDEPAPDALVRNAMREELLDVLYAEIEGSKHAELFIEYYLHERQLKEVAEERGVTYVSARQGVSRLANRVKDALVKRGLVR
jgi:RNA polymerase sigma factor (sigma-70 family)